jgi:hypothetical protein
VFSGGAVRGASTGDGRVVGGAGGGGVGVGVVTIRGAGVCATGFCAGAFAEGLDAGGFAAGDDGWGFGGCGLASSGEGRVLPDVGASAGGCWTVDCVRGGGCAGGCVRGVCAGGWAGAGARFSNGGGAGRCVHAYQAYPAAATATMVAA